MILVINNSPSIVNMLDVDSEIYQRLWEEREFLLFTGWSIGWYDESTNKTLYKIMIKVKLNFYLLEIDDCILF